MKPSWLLTAIALLGSMAFPAHADTSIGLKAGTLGAGVEMAHAFGERWGIRVAANGLKYDYTDTHESVDYDAELRLETAQLLFDWYPFASGFRVSLGAAYNGNKATLVGKPTGGTYTINDVTYNASDIGSLNGAVDFQKTAGYAGIGYGRPIGKGLSFTADLGVLFQGKPNVALTAVCGPTASASTCSELQSDVAAEQAQLQDDADKYRYYPVLSIGLAWVF